MNRVLLDACVLFPSVTRELLIGAARVGLYEPVWSAKIIEEWRYAAKRTGVGAQADIEIALLRADWPRAEIAADEALEAQLSLPDRHDRHVLAAAINGGAAELLTRNLKDFPTRVLARHGIIRREPDGFLREMAGELHGVVDVVHQRAEAMAGQALGRRSLLKKAGLPKLGKFFE
jgi:hypothetical protein